LKALSAEREELAVRLKAAEERERQAQAQLAKGQKEREAYALQLKSLEKRQKVSDQNQKTLMKTISENKDTSMTDFAGNMQANNKKMAKTVKSAQTRKRVSITVYAANRHTRYTAHDFVVVGVVHFPEHGHQEKSHKH
jgi:predicted transcriptional regulator